MSEMKSIKFTHCHGGQMPIDHTTCTTPIVQLGALLHTMTASGEFATDAAGIEAAGLMVDSAIVSFATNIESIGELLAYADVDNVSSRALTDIGWLVATLGNHVRTLANLKTSLEDVEIRTNRKGGK